MRLKTIKQSFIKLLGTLRSILSKKTDQLPSKEKTQPKPPEEKPKEVRLMCPFAEDYSLVQKTRGDYRKGFPEGAVIHYTAGSGTLRDAANHAEKKRYNYFIIDKQGKIAQLAPLNRWGSHAGKSSCYLGENVSQFLVGIEVICAGRLTKLSDPQTGGYIYKTWWGKDVPERFVNEKGDKAFEKFTVEQEAALSNLIMWLKREKPDVFMIDNVFGHEEVSPGRKEDPGLSLSEPMYSYRSKLKENLF